MPIVELKAETVIDRHGMPLHTNLNFGGRFGHSAIYHSVCGGTAAQAMQEVAIRLDANRDWHIKQGHTVIIETTCTTTRLRSQGL